MDLIPCERYLGDVSTPPVESNLNDFIDKVKSRRKKRETSFQTDNADLSVATSSSHSNEKSETPSKSSPVGVSKKPKGDKESKKTRQLKTRLEQQQSDTLKEDKLSRRKKHDTTFVEADVADVSVAPSSPNSFDKLDISSSESSKKSKGDKESKKSGKSKASLEQRRSVTFNEEVVAEDGNTSALKTSQTKDKPKKKKKKSKKKGAKSKNQEVAEWTVPVACDESDVKYEVLGNFEFENKVKVKRVLPRWLAEPTIISDDVHSVDESMNIENLKNLSPKIKINMISNQVKNLFPVQSAVIPYLLAEIKNQSALWSRDICVSAPTGSGKTLAYVIPLLQAKSALIFNVLHALVIVPVQELAIQVACVFEKYASRTSILIGCITGGTDFANEAKNLVKKKADGTFCSTVDILIATPGRLVEHMLNTKGFTLEHLRYIVIDEADRVMEQRSLNWLHLLEKQYDFEHLGSVPAATIHNLQKRRRRPQKLLFSATLSQDPEKLLQLNLFQPRLFTCVKKEGADKTDKGRFLGKFTVPSNVSEFSIECQGPVKPLVIVELIRQKNWSHIMCFTKSCEEAKRLSMLISILLPNLEISQVTTLLPLKEREKALEALAAGCVDLLVCSDRVARGMDIPGVKYVILYDPPKYVKGYVHRIGRTGRAGVAGTALTLLTPPQSSHFKEMLAAVGHPAPAILDLDQDTLDVESLSYKNALNTLAINIKKEHSTKIKRLKLEKRKGMAIGPPKSTKRPKKS